MYQTLVPEPGARFSYKRRFDKYDGREHSSTMRVHSAFPIGVDHGGYNLYSGITDPDDYFFKIGHVDYKMENMTYEHHRGINATVRNAVFVLSLHEN